MTDKPVISILGGTGAQGSALALRWVDAGYPVVIGSRNAQKAAKACEKIASQVEKANISHDDNAAAAAKGEIVVLCVPYATQRDTVESVRSALEGKVLIDATVPLVPPKVARVQLPEGGSAVAVIQAMLGDSVKVVSAFQNVAAHVLGDLSSTVECDVLAGDIGMRAIHAGPIANSAAAEALTSILISINSRYKVSGAGVRITRLDTGKQ